MLWLKMSRWFLRLILLHSFYVWYSYIVVPLIWHARESGQVCRELAGREKPRGLRICGHLRPSQGLRSSGPAIQEYWGQ